MQYEALEKQSIYELWCNDLDNFLKVLTDYEAKEEEDRKATGGMQNDGKKKRKAPVRGKKKEERKE